MDLIERYRTAWSRYCKSHGFGIHSPFAYRFVLNVMNERLPYYAYEDIEQLRESVKQEVKSIGKHPKVISLKHAKLMFRVTNHFKPKAVLQIGSSYGVSAVSALYVSKDIKMWLHEPRYDSLHTLQNVLKPFRDRIELGNHIVHSIGDYDAAIADINQSPFVIVNNIPNDIDYNQLQVYIYSILDREGVVIFRNIAKKGLMRQMWEDSKQYAQKGMSFSNDRFAVFVATQKLPRQDFLLWI